jgi:hypothetical protein
MKYAITGHTSGIGKGLFNHLSPAAIGFSLSTGYDIRSRADRIRIIDESEDCDVFINNAPASFAQTELFLELFEHWKHKDKTIINVGSRIAEIQILPPSHQFLLGYQAEKLILKEMSKKTQDAKCKVNYRWFAYVGTDRILKKYPNFTEKDYISVDSAIEIILS